ncbi:MAG: HAD hydrolase-like protein [Chloroflexi bacterium]|jgi:phosphoglycolate phosphatase|nr:HAD hydrolase-like protein [Chloroflexota bacterium]MBT7081212.1 HAD hydrolase-like protein [Chloroflexota bacterium]MBT7290267.1 HAD hydrolase-like protein [Chloroflexota bacterium]
MIKNVFFDLDGTLSDPMEGITNCINYSLEKLGKPTRPRAELIEFIGPPLRQSYASIFETGDEALIEKAMVLYRERFTEVGMYENQLYDGVEALLQRLVSSNMRLFVVTSKPTVYAKRIVAYFGLNDYFEQVYGPELNGLFDDKAELIGHVLKQHSLIPSETIMIGDREVDIIAGKSNGTRTIGVTYGYGSRQDLQDCTPDHICDRPGKILSVLGVE